MSLARVWIFILLADLAIAGTIGCATTLYIQAPPPPCFDAPTKREIGALCTGEWGAAGACESFGSWMQSYIQWRKGVYGRKLCRLDTVEADE